MSYVISIQRGSGGTPLTRSEINAALDADQTIERKDEGIAEWVRPDSTERLYFNIEDSSLWTDDFSASEIDTLLPKLRELALALEAEVVGEEGEVLTSSEESTAPAGAGGFSMLIGLVLTLVVLPFIAAVFVIRLPYLLWQVFRAAR